MEDKVPKKMEEEGDDEDEEQKRRYQSFKRKGERKHWRSFEWGERKLNFTEVSKEDENDTKGSNIPLI